ncbi:SAM-dependent methyltransferase [Kitasatospora aureofaciens]|uniref:SAM-dependent methyltransferase n=1 Tax=Kitasatospora aureofaciens TaxID=1894 RepID=UPI000524275E|nr:SAM-dependent methyltransferase [Kitasatospora aureofaciens]HJD85059.1 SAM-dependent methyltransferase [Kitasatospora aureofaciens]
MRRPSWVPEGTDLDKPNAARVYDYYLGGSHNFEVDREMARKALALWPELPQIMRSNRAFLRRAVTFLSEQGITRFLDIGSGIPTFGAVHEIARAIRPGAKVVYVDRDPVAVAHSRLLLEDDPDSAVVQADLRDVEDLLDRPEVAALLAEGEPVAVLLVAVAHFVSDDENPSKLIATIRDRLPAGSALALSHASLEARPDQAEDHQKLYRMTPTPLTMRTNQQVTAMFAGFELVEPGVVPLPRWRPDQPGTVGEHPERIAGVAGVGFRS